MSPSPWVTTTEAITYLRMDDFKNPREALRRLFKRNKIKAVTRGRERLTRIEWLDSYLKREAVS